MISFSEAFDSVVRSPGLFGTETVKLQDCTGRVLAQDIHADRDYPPFNRSTKDGIAVNYKAIEKGRIEFNIKGVIAAGTAIARLKNPDDCLEIMTGAVIPTDADTVVMYEDIRIEKGIAYLTKKPQRGQNIHIKGSDEKKGAIILKAGTIITASEVGVLATVGKPEIPVIKLPKISVISTGNELVDVGMTPLPHQIRRSNSYSIQSSLLAEGINASLLHLPDDPDKISQELEKAIEKSDVLLLSGGVSKGKFDFIPQVMSELGVSKVFHGVQQRPGKPFWFGIHKTQHTWIFSFPGNPVSTFVNYHVYFKNWLYKSLGIPIQQLNVFLQEEIAIEGTLTRFIRVETGWKDGCLTARRVSGNGSGDLISLASSDGFIKLEPREEPYKPLELVPFIPCRFII